ncbi:MAG: phosphoribosylformylglycinamidine synthase [Bacteroidales bacterium]|nr:phosphoribosylformylglycinamidine synthase [Bacteroidales bacterium]
MNPEGQILFFKSENGTVIAVNSTIKQSDAAINALQWLFSNASLLPQSSLEGLYVGPRREMITPWSTTAVEIAANMNIGGIARIEEFFPVETEDASYDKMLQRLYKGLDQDVFTISRTPEDIVYITDFEAYDRQEGLALSKEEIAYLQNLSSRLGRPLTDSEVFGFSQVNSEHCRHKIFNGTFIIDGKEMESSLFKLIKKTTQTNPNEVVSAYKDNCAFIEGPEVEMFHPSNGAEPSLFEMKGEKTVISLKAETHNFPTTVEPFNGAATGTGGEIRDRIAGGKGSFPIAGTAVYMTPYPRFEEAPRKWEETKARPWLYQTPQQLLIKASNGASDFGNKFGQPIICGSLLTFEHSDEAGTFGFDKVIMQAGGVGFAKKKDSLKETPETGDAVVLLGGDNYRIGMGGGAVSSVATGEYANAIELNAVQRSNPEMQKRAYNAIRAISEEDTNTIISVHDHGAGGHLNCLSELVEETGGTIDISALPIGDPTLSYKEIIGNESQERMGLVMKQSDAAHLKDIAERERAPFYNIGKTTGEHNFTLRDSKTGKAPIDLAISDMLGSTPRTIMTDTTVNHTYADVKPVSDYSPEQLKDVVCDLMTLESVACKDWLTNKVDRSVTGLIACQQTAGEIQLPLNDVAVTAIGYDNKEGIATSIGHAPAVGLIDAAAGSRIAIAEALTNMVWAPLKGGRLNSVSLSANWMWPCRNDGENARLYNAVKGASDFAIALGINIPTGKDSMSMTQKYPTGEKVLSPGTLIISTVGQVSDVSKTLHAVFEPRPSKILYIPFDKEASYQLGGSAYAQICSKVGAKCVDVKNPGYFVKCFEAVQEIVENEYALAGHDISAGGLVTTLLEGLFGSTVGGLKVSLAGLDDNVIFSEMPAVVLQVADDKASQCLGKAGVAYYEIGEWNSGRTLEMSYSRGVLSLDVDRMRDSWFSTSHLLDSRQVAGGLADARFENYKKQPLQYIFPSSRTADTKTGRQASAKRPLAAIIREKGSNGDREMAWALYMAGFEVRDVHTTDLTSGRETLEDVSMIVFVGGFSNADTLGSAKGWAGALLYNDKARSAIEKFYARPDTLSLGICNGCQLMAELGLITPDQRERSPKMKHNDSHKFESTFVGVTIAESPSVMLKSLEGSKLGIWVAHGEGKFEFGADNGAVVAVRYNYNDYPGNPNGSPGGVAGVCSPDGRHLAMMPHPERCLRPWNWPWYPAEKRHDVSTPWLDMFVNARRWLEK